MLSIGHCGLLFEAGIFFDKPNAAKNAFAVYSSHMIMKSRLFLRRPLFIGFIIKLNENTPTSQSGGMNRSTSAEGCPI